MAHMLLRTTSHQSPMLDNHVQINRHILRSINRLAAGDAKGRGGGGASVASSESLMEAAVDRSL